VREWWRGGVPPRLRSVCGVGLVYESREREDGAVAERRLRGRHRRLGLDRRLVARNPLSVRRRTTSVRLFLAICVVAAVAVPTAYAKGEISIKIADRTPRVGQRFTVTVDTGWVVPANDWLRLIAVAPGKRWYDVVGTVTGDSSQARATIPRDGFEIKLRRVAPRRWRAYVQLPRPGRWRLVVPNGTHVGFMIPPPASWMPWVDVHR
jgi:hypothetical protein